MGRKHKETTPISPAELAAVRAALTPVPLDTIPWDNIAKAVYTAELADTPAIPTAETLPVVMVKGPDTTSVEIEWFPPNELANTPAIPPTEPITYHGIPLEFIPPWDKHGQPLVSTTGSTEKDSTAETPASTEPATTLEATNTSNQATTPEAELGMGAIPAAAAVTPNIFGRGSDGRFRPAPPKPVAPPPPPKPSADIGLVQGLSLIPYSWPPLPDNASLQAELGWVQSQRLSIVEERGNTTVVHLERASSPAPSKAALGWLETSIRSYAKYIDIVSRALSTAVDEQEHTRRERMRLDEITSLLDEMQGAC